jgi:hypothetical protein
MIAEERSQADYIYPGKPMQTGFVESYNGRLREECLNPELFLDRDDAKRKVSVSTSFTTTCDLIRLSGVYPRDGLLLNHRSRYL